MVCFQKQTRFLVKQRSGRISWMTMTLSKINWRFYFIPHNIWIYPKLEKQLRAKLIHFHNQLF